MVCSVVWSIVDVGRLCLRFSGGGNTTVWQCWGSCAMLQMHYYICIVEIIPQYFWYCLSCFSNGWLFTLTLGEYIKSARHDTFRTVVFLDVQRASDVLVICADDGTMAWGMLCDGHVREVQVYVMITTRELRSHSFSHHWRPFWMEPRFNYCGSYSWPRPLKLTELCAGIFFLMQSELYNG